MVSSQLKPFRLSPLLSIKILPGLARCRFSLQEGGKGNFRGWFGSLEAGKAFLGTSRWFPTALRYAAGHV